MTGLKKTIRISLITIGSAVLLCIIATAVALWFVFTPSKLTPIVEKAASEYTGADIGIGKVDLVFFSSFPRLALKIDNGTLTIRDTSGRSASGRDSLIEFKRCRIVFNPVAYLSENRLIIHRIFIDSARIHAYRDADGNANWNLFNSKSAGHETDTSAAGQGFMPKSVLLRSLRIKDADIVFNDRLTDTYAGIRNVNTTLKFGAGIKGMGADMDFSCADILFYQQGDLLLKRTALTLKATAGLNRDSMKVVLKNAELGINDMDFTLDGYCRRDTMSKAARLDLNFTAAAPSVENALRLIPESVVEHKALTADGSVMLEGRISGGYGKNILPTVTLCLKIDNASARYEGLPYGIERLSADFDAFIDLMREQESFMDLKIFQLKGHDIDVLANAKVTEIFKDPLISLNTVAAIDFGSISKTLPLKEGIRLSGDIDADIKIRTRLSTLKNQDFGRIFAAGKIRMDSVVVKDSASGTEAVGDIDLRFFGGKALGMDGTVSKLHFNSPAARAIADSLQLKIISTRPKDTSRVFRMNANLTMDRIGASIGDSLKIFCGRGSVKAGLGPGSNSMNRPEANIEIETDSLFVKSGGQAGGMKKGVITIKAEKLRDSIWKPSGRLSFGRMVLHTPGCALPLRINRTVIRFGDRKISLKKAAVRIGHSNAVLTGNVYDLYGAMKKGKILRADLDISSRNININQLLRAFSAGDATEQEIEADTVSAGMKLFKVPDNIDFRLTTDIGRLRFGKYIFHDIKGNAELKDSHVYLENLTLGAFGKTTIEASLIYKAATQRFGYAGFDLKVHDVDIATLVDATPSIDSLVPMLQSFKGKVQMDVAAEAVLDSVLNIRIPSLRSAVYIRGDSLVLMDGETFAEISKKLMFKNRKENMIDSISVNITVEDGSVNIYPFLLKIDRYQAAVGGVQNMDMSFDYHISILKSPLPFKAGLNIRGTIDDMKFGIGRAKYKNAVTPVATRHIDSLRINLSDEITRRFRSAAERSKWGDRAAGRAKIDWDRKRDSTRRHHRRSADEDSIEWERLPR